MASPTGSAAVTAIKPARTFPNANVIHAIRHSFRQGATPAGGETIPAMPLGAQHHIGTIPKGSTVCRVWVHIVTAPTTTPVFIIGTVGDDDGILTTAEAAPTATGIKQNLIGGALMGYTAVELQLYAKLSVASGGTVGDIHTVIEFYPPKT
jgi:hypothetical protein